MKLRLIYSMTINQEKEARRKNLQNHINLLKSRYPRDKYEEAVQLLQERIDRIAIMK